MKNLLLILATVLSATRVAGRLSSQEGKNDIYDTTGGKGEAIEYEYLAPVIEGVNMTDVVVAQEYAKVHFIDQERPGTRVGVVNQRLEERLEKESESRNPKIWNCPIRSPFDK
jgi:hypothetical protein